MVTPLRESIEELLLFATRRRDLYLFWNCTFAWAVWLYVGASTCWCFIYVKGGWGWWFISLHYFCYSREWYMPCFWRLIGKSIYRNWSVKRVWVCAMIITQLMYIWCGVWICRSLINIPLGEVWSSFAITILFCKWLWWTFRCFSNSRCKEKWALVWKFVFTLSHSYL